MNILIITNTRIGDTVLTTGVINHYIKIYPTAKLTIATGFLAAPLFSDCANMKEMIPVVKKPYFGHWFLLWKKCCTTKWDLIIDFKGSFISIFLYSKKRIFRRKKSDKISKATENAMLAKLNYTPPLHLWINASRFQAIKEKTIMAQGKILITLAPTANWLPKMWPIENFISLTKKLIAEEKFLDAVFLIVSAPNESSLCKPLLDALAPQQFIDLTDHTPLLTKAAFIKQSTIFIGNDSGLMHIASACQTPIIALFGPTDTTAYYPQGENVAILKAPYLRKKTPETDQSIMRKIAVSDVVNAVFSLLK